MLWNGKEYGKSEIKISEVKHSLKEIIDQRLLQKMEYFKYLGR
jgi:hypothetical protein